MAPVAATPGNPQNKTQFVHLIKALLRGLSSALFEYNISLAWA
jgi:hypothetical protein